MREESLNIRLQSQRSQFGEHSTPMYLTSSYTFEHAEQMRARFSDEEEGNIYSRYSNPTVTEFIVKMARLEGMESGFCHGFWNGSGVFYFWSIVKSG